MKSIALAALLLLTALASGQTLERTISLRDTFGWLRGEQSFAYDTRRQLAYVCGGADSVLFVLDGATNAKTARISVPFGITGIVYDSLDDRLFCARGEANSVVVLDCGTMGVVAAIPVGEMPSSIHYADHVNKAYVVNDSSISVLDCGTMTESRRLPVPAGISELLYNHVTNTLWFYVVEGEDSLYVVDCAVDSIVAHLDVGWDVWGLDCDQLTGMMFCIDGGEEVVVIDGADFQVRDRIETEGEVWALACAWRRGWLYMIEYEGIEVYDCRAGEVVDTISYEREDDLVPARYSPEADVVWLAWSGCWCGPGHVAVIDCATNNVFQGPGVFDPLALNAAPNGLTYLCSDDEPMFILKNAGQMFAGVVTDGFRPDFVTCNPMDGMVYASGEPPTVVVIDPSLDAVFVHPGIDYVSNACLNTIDNKLYGWSLMAHTWCTDLVVFDGVGRRVSGMVRTGYDPWTLCVNPAEDKVYCGSYYGEDLRVFDGVSNALLARLELGFAASDLEVASIENKLYCGSYAGPNRVTVIDCGGDSVLRTISMTGGQNEFCYNSTERRMYCLTGGGLEVTAIDCRTDTVESVIRLRASGSSLHMNSRENKLYVTLPDSGQVAVINCAADTLVANIAVGAGQWYTYMQACFDAQGNKLYCSVTSENSVAVIDGKGDSLLMKLATGLSPVGVTFDPGTGRLFVANPGDGTISVFRDSSSASQRRGGDLGRIPTIARGRLIMPAPHTGQLLDITGRKVLDLHPGVNDVRALPSGIYFVREAQVVRKVIVAR